MKLYTENQVKMMLVRAKLYRGAVYDNFAFIMPEDEVLNSETPIELPSDDEIYNKCSDWVFRENPTKWSVNDDTAGDNMNSFAHGAKWMRNKIQNKI